MNKDRKNKLCPFKKIVEREYSSRTGKGTYNERFALCVGDRSMAYRPGGYCARMEDRK